MVEGCLPRPTQDQEEGAWRRSANWPKAVFHIFQGCCLSLQCSVLRKGGQASASPGLPPARPQWDGGQSTGLGVRRLGRAVPPYADLGPFTSLDSVSLSVTPREVPARLSVDPGRLTLPRSKIAPGPSLELGDTGNTALQLQGVYAVRL